MEQTCSLIVLSNLCRVLSRTPPAVASMRALVTTQILPAILTYARQRLEHTRRIGFDEAMQAVFAAIGELVRETKDREECVQAMVRSPSDTAEEEVRRYVRMGTHCAERSVSVDATPRPNGSLSEELTAACRVCCGVSCLGAGIGWFLVGASQARSIEFDDLRQQITAVYPPADQTEVRWTESAQREIEKATAPQVKQTEHFPVTCTDISSRC